LARMWVWYRDMSMRNLCYYIHQHLWGNIRAKASGFLEEYRGGQLKAVRCYGELKIRAAAYKLQKTPKGGSHGYCSDPQY